MPLLLLTIFHQRFLIVFHGSMSNTKSSPVFRTLLSIQTDLNSAVIWIFTILSFLVPPGYFIILESFQVLVIVITLINLNCYHLFPYVPVCLFFRFSGKIQIFVYLFAFFYCSSLVSLKVKKTLDDNFLHLLLTYLNVSSLCAYKLYAILLSIINFFFDLIIS